MMRKLFWYQACALIVTYIAYSVYHVARKSFPNTKARVIETWGPPNAPSNETAIEDVYPYNWAWSKHRMCTSSAECVSMAGTLDTIYAVSYAVSIFAWGHIGDRVDPRIVLTIGMFGGGWALIFFGFVSEQLEFYSFPYLAFFFLLYGCFQATGWPNVVHIVSNWVGRSRRGVVMGIWGSCVQAGNIAGGMIAGAVLHNGYEYIYLSNAALLWSAMFLTFFGIVTWPRQVGLEPPSEHVHSILDVGDRRRELAESSSQNPSSADLVNTEKPFRSERLHSVDSLISDASRVKIPSDLSEVKKVADADKPFSFIQAILLPGVLPSSFALFFVKLVDYSFFFWLASYLINVFKWNAAIGAQMSTAYDWGGLVGGIFFGLLSDLLGVRSPVLTVMLIIASAILYGFSTLTGASAVSTAVTLMVFGGFCISGASNMITGAVSADLGRQKAVQGKSKKALSTVTGIIDGTGSLGAALGPIYVPMVALHASWKILYLSFVVFLLVAVLCLLPVTIRESREFWRKFQRLRRHIDKGDLSWREVFFGEKRRSSYDGTMVPPAPTAVLKKENLSNYYGSMGASPTDAEV